MLSYASFFFLSIEVFHWINGLSTNNHTVLKFGRFYIFDVHFRFPWYSLKSSIFQVALKGNRNKALTRILNKSQHNRSWVEIWGPCLLYYSHCSTFWSFVCCGTIFPKEVAPLIFVWQLAAKDQRNMAIHCWP